jgi:hypothetical protein
MPDETAPQPQIKIAWLIGTLAAFALFALIGAYSARMTQDYTDYDQQRADDRKVTLAKVQHDENALLSTAEWVDQAKGAIRIPIEEAMVKELDTLKGKPAAMGAVIPPPAPPAPAKPAPAAGATSAGKPAASQPAATNVAPTKPSAPAAGLPTAGAAPTPPPAQPQPNK